MNIKKTVVFGILLILSIFTTFFLLASSNDEKNIEQTAKNFLAYVAGKEIEKAKALSTGIVLFNLANMEQNLSKKHLVLETEVELLSMGPAWAVVRAKVESVNPANETSVHWYEMQLIKQDGWKVYKLKETGPGIKKGRPSPADKEKCEETFRLFSDALLAGKYAEAGKHLIGQAKNAHEMSGGWFKDVITGKSGMKELSSSVIAGDGKSIILEIRYAIDDKENKVAVSCHKTSRGWKIFDIAQI